MMVMMREKITLRELEERLSNVDYHQEIFLLRDEIPDECRATRLGLPKGADAQYRCPGNIHIRCYGDLCTAHKDMVDPRKNPIGHFTCDFLKLSSLCKVNMK